MQLLFQVSRLQYEYQADDVVADSNWTQILRVLILVLLRVRLVQVTVLKLSLAVRARARQRQQMCCWPCRLRGAAGGQADVPVQLALPT